jgi:mono/diheme cytochrome c family protein
MKQALRIAVAAAALGLCSQPVAFAKDLSQRSGKELYQRLCSGCHGERGEGDGIIGTYFKLQPPNLTQLARNNGGEFPADEVRKIIDGRNSPGAHGSREMPVWGVALYDTDAKSSRQEQQVDEMIDRLVEYLRTIQRP